MDDFRPVSLTSPARKVFEKMMKQVIEMQVEGFFDPMLFAYSGKGIGLLVGLYHHLESPMSHARFFY